MATAELARVRKSKVEFKSKGVTCRGDLWLPERGAPPYPVVVMAGGWCYVKEIVMPHYAQFFCGEGLAVLMFDYRNLGASDGEPRQHLDPWAQIEDYRNAISFVETVPELDPARIVVWGISYSGGHALIVGAIDRRVRCIVSNIPVVDGYETQRRVHGERRFAQLLQVIAEDRARRYRGEPSGRLPMSAPDPDQVLCTWPFPEVYSAFDAIKRAEAPRHEHWSTIESTELLLTYTVFPYVTRILDTPTLMLVAEGDNITSWDLEIAAFNLIPSPHKELFIIPRTSHMSLYTERQRLEIAATYTARWLREQVLQPTEAAVGRSDGRRGAARQRGAGAGRRSRG